MEDYYFYYSFYSLYLNFFLAYIYRKDYVLKTILLNQSRIFLQNVWQIIEIIDLNGIHNITYIVNKRSQWQPAKFICIFTWYELILIKEINADSKSQL